LPRETENLTEAEQAALTRGPAPNALMAALFPCPLAEWEPSTYHKNRLGLRLRREIFYQMDGECLLMASLPYLSRWPLYLSSSSMKELIQGEQPLRLCWPSIFMSSSSPATVKVAEIPPCIHYSQVNPASLKEECIPDLASLCKITP
jgi:hypothetical protein